jgi:hypothetical protein
MRRLSLAFAGLLLVAAAAANAQTGTLITCESINNVRHTCRADVTNGVIMNRQLSNDTCVRGKTWGTNREMNGIWVDAGCRGEFIVGGSVNRSQLQNGYPHTMTCGSDLRRGQRCPADTSYGVQMTRQLSKHSCLLNKDWGYDNNGLWVKNGCRAEFEIGGTLAPMASSSGSTIICESSNGTNQRCAANTTYGVTLNRQLSNTACVRGQTWGVDGDGVWVSNGCRAEFLVGRNP